MASKMWFGQATGKRGNPVWVRVRRDGGLNDGDRARFGITDVPAWFEVEAADVKTAKAKLAAGDVTPLGNAKAPAKKAKAPAKAPAKARTRKPKAAPAPAPAPAPEAAVAAA